VQTTPNLGLKKPEANDTVNIADLNYNADVLDQEVVKRLVNSGGAPSIQAGLDAEKPAPGTAGRLYVATDTQIIYRDTGSAWTKVGAVKWGDIDGKPSAFTPALHGNEAHDPDLALASDLTAHLADKVQHIPYVVATGSANTYSVTINGVTSYQEGLAIAVKINVDNTGASTLNVNNLGAKPIKRPNGTDVPSGYLKAGNIYTVRYNGTNFILQGEVGVGTAQPGDVLSGKTFTNDSGLQTGTMPNNGAVVITPGTSDIAIPAGYHNGSGYVKGDANLVVANIKSGVSIFGVTGTVKEYKAASGSVSVSNTSTQTVSGLGFTPQVIIIIYTSSSITFVCSYKEGYVDLWHRNPPGATLDGKNPAFSVSSGQFSFCVPNSSWVPGTANWYAYGY